MALSAELREKIAQQANQIDQTTAQITSRVVQNAKNDKSAQVVSRLDNPINSPSVSKVITDRQSAQIASRLDNPINSPSVTKSINTRSAQIASRLDGGNYAANTGTQAAIVQRTKDQKSAQAAANLDNSLMGQATRDNQKASFERAMESLYNQMEIAKSANNMQDYTRAQERYGYFADKLQDLNNPTSTAAYAADWEANQRTQIVEAGGEELMKELFAIAELKEQVDVEERANQASEILKAPSKTWYEYQQRVAALRALYGDDVMNWLAFAEREENKARASKTAAGAKKAGKDAPFASSLASIGTNMVSGAGFLDAAAQKAQRAITGSGVPVDYNRAAQRPAQVTTNLRQGVSEDMGQVGSFLYNTGMSMLDSAAVMASGGVGTALLGGAAATNAMQEAVQRGASDGQALTVGLVAGAMEAVMEKASIDSLFKLKTPEKAKDVVLNILKQAGAEGTEEGLTTLATTVADALIMGNRSELQTQKRELMAQGYTEKEAERMAATEWAKNLALDVAGGALSGGLFGSIKSGVDSVMPKLQPKAQTQAPVADITPTVQQNKNAPVNETEAESTAVNKNGAKQLTDATSAPVLTAETGFAQTPNPNIPNPPENVNGGNPAMGAADSGFDPYSHASIEHGAIPPGENPARVVDVPKSMDGESNVMQTVRTIMEADATPDAAIPELEQAVVEGKFSKMPITDQAASERAEATIRRVGYQQALADWRAEVRNGKVSKDSIVVGETLYNAAVNAGDMKSAVKIAVELSTQVRSAAQALQAVRMLKKMSPAAQLYGVKQSVDNLQKTLTDKYGNRAPDLVINEELAAKFLEAETDADRKIAEEALYKDIAKQIPATFADKWNAWRYLSMLGNARTHVRNIAGNAMFAPVRFVKNKVGAAMEAGAQAVGLIDKSQRTKAFGAAGKDLMAAARADYENVKQQVLSGGKYNSSSDIIEENRQIFEPRVAKAAGKAVKKLTGADIPKWVENISIEGLRKGNSKALEAEDSFFSKGAYASSLASYLKAQGFTAADFSGDGMTAQQKDAARAYAIKEAQKATYRDINGFSEAISSIGFKKPGDSKTKHILNSAVEGVMPFKKTPANILVRSVEYSPAGLAKAITTDAYAVAKGKISAGEYMDRLASGLTGTGLFAIGCFLSNAGLLVGGTPEDEDQAELEGRQPYSLEIGGKSITLDWLAPEAMPVFMGVELMEAIREGGGDASLTDKVLSFIHGLSGPMLEMSMMSSLQEALEATEYADNKLLAFMANGALGYLKQAQPTLFGQLERALGSTVRETTFLQEGDKFLNKDAQYMVGSVANKIPGVDFNQIPYIDAWGRTEQQGNTGTRLFNNMLNPAYISDIQETPVDAEIKRLEKETGVNLTPTRAKTVITIDGEKILLTSDEYVTYAQAKGQNDLTFRQNLIDAESYVNLDDQAKVKAMEFAKDLADALAVKEAGFDDPNMPDWQKELVEADAETVTEALVRKAVESQAGLSEGNKYLGLSDMLDSGTIDDQLALACMSTSCYDAYTANCEKADISVQQFLDAYGTAYANGTTSAERKQAALDYIKGLDISAKQKGALAQAVHEAIGSFIPQDTQLPDQWLLDIGDTNRIVQQMGEEQREKYNTYIKGSNVETQTYLDMMEYYSSDAVTGDESRDTMEKYIRNLKVSDAEKGRLYCSLYAEKTCPKDLMVAAFGVETAEQYISDARKEGYEKYVKGTNIDILTYFDLVDYYNSSESDGTKGKDGKVIKGQSKQDKVLAWIAKLKIPNKDKGRLFCSLYSAKNCPSNWR